MIDVLNPEHTESKPLNTTELETHEIATAAPEPAATESNHNLSASTENQPAEQHIVNALPRAEAPSNNQHGAGEQPPAQNSERARARRIRIRRLFAARGRDGLRRAAGVV